MKNLKTILITFFLLQSIFSFAQTKEETVLYIQNLLKLSNGNGDKSKLIVLDQKFNLDLVTTKKRRNEVVGGIKQDIDETVSVFEIPWSEAFILQEMPISGGLVYFCISFHNNAKAKEIEKLLFHYHQEDIENDEEFTNIIEIYVPSGKEQNFKKAFSHLSDLIKKEDPFGN
jgi:hypothetical protein